MRNRRAFLQQVAGATAGLFVARSGFPAAAPAQVGAAAGKRREVSVGGRRIKTIDIHAHTFVPEVWDVVKDTPLAAVAKGNLTGYVPLGNPQRLIDMRVATPASPADSCTTGATTRRSIRAPTSTPITYRTGSSG